MGRDRSIDAKVAENAKSVILTARFTEDQAVKLDAAWTAQGFPNRSAFLRHLALTAAGEPSASPAILQMMSDIRKDLAAIGRNVNQAAREMNRRRKIGIPVDPGTLVKIEDLDALRGELRKVVDALKSVLKKAPKKRKAKA